MARQIFTPMARLGESRFLFLCDRLISSMELWENAICVSIFAMNFMRQQQRRETTTLTKTNEWSLLVL